MKQIIRLTGIWGITLSLLAACNSGASGSASASQGVSQPGQTTGQSGQATSEGGSNQTVPIPPENCTITPQDMEGPYYVADAPFREDIRANAPGDILMLSGTVYSEGCAAPLAGAVVDIWQADANGNYDFSDQFILRGKAETDDQGHYQFITVMPGYYGEGGAVRPLHIHLKVSHPDTKSLTTQIYFEGDQYANGVDPLLITPYTQTSDGFTMVFNIILGN